MRIVEKNIKEFCGLQDKLKKKKHLIMSSKYKILCELDISICSTASAAWE